jgi:hypothetical protein
LSDSGDEDDQQALREEDQICPRIWHKDKGKTYMKICFG